MAEDGSGEDRASGAVAKPPAPGEPKGPMGRAGGLRSSGTSPASAAAGGVRPSGRRGTLADHHGKGHHFTAGPARLAGSARRAALALLALALLALAALATAAPFAGAGADPTPSPDDGAGSRLDLLYDARFLGLPVGTMAVHLTQADGRYAAEVNGRASGLYWALKGVRAHRSVRGRVAAPGHDADGQDEDALPLRPTVYRDAFLEWDDAADTIVTFSTEDGIPSVTREGTISDRVPFEQRPGTIDPITAILIARQRVAESVRAERRDAMHMVFPVLEGKSRYDVTVRVEPPVRIHAAGQPWRARRAVVSFEPIAGFSEKHAAEFREGVVRIAFSDHVDAIPIRIDVDLGWGGFNLIYRGRCGRVDEPCPRNEVDTPDTQ